MNDQQIETSGQQGVDEIKQIPFFVLTKAKINTVFVITEGADTMQIYS